MYMNVMICLLLDSLPLFSFDSACENQIVDVNAQLKYVKYLVISSSA
jgi:hypothetical protein